jgi:hypothetical protein
MNGLNLAYTDDLGRETARVLWEDEWILQVEKMGLEIWGPLAPKLPVDTQELHLLKFRRRSQKQSRIHQ